jgi:hypothetical protein
LYVIAFHFLEKHYTRKLHPKAHKRASNSDEELQESSPAVAYEGRFRWIYEERIPI